MMKYECLKWAQIYSDIPLFPQNCYQLQTGPGSKRGTSGSTPDILFEFSCVGPVCAAVWFCCSFHALKAAGRVHLNCGENKILEHQRHHFLFLETKPNRERRQLVCFTVHEGSALRQGKLSLVIWVLVAQTFPRIDFGLKSAFKALQGEICWHWDILTFCH